MLKCAGVFLSNEKPGGLAEWVPAAAGEWLPGAKRQQDGQPRAERTERHREATQSDCDDLAGKVDGSVMLYR